jgi:hypothetical protein
MAADSVASIESASSVWADDKSPAVSRLRIAERTSMGARLEMSFWGVSQRLD